MIPNYYKTYARKTSKTRNITYRINSIGGKNISFYSPQTGRNYVWTIKHFTNEMKEV